MAELVDAGDLILVEHLRKMGYGKKFPTERRTNGYDSVLLTNKTSG